MCGLKACLLGLFRDSAWDLRCLSLPVTVSKQTQPNTVRACLCVSVGLKHKQKYVSSIYPSFGHVLLLFTGGTQPPEHPMTCEKEHNML